MSVPKCLFSQDLEGLTEVFGRMSAGISGQKLPLWAEFSFLNFAFPLQRPRPATGVSRALRAGSVPGVSLGVSLGPFGLRAPECPKSVPRVSAECPGHLFDTPGTLSGHFLDTPEPGAQRAPETPRGTLPGHFGPEGPERLL